MTNALNPDRTAAPPAPDSPPPADRISRRQVDKFAQRRDQLAEAALQTLAELGYARTSLREIAANSEYSHGVLQYYFRDEVELITCCVRQYKARCATRYDEAVATATTAEELVAGFLREQAATLTGEPEMHRLWYDLRNQAMFEPVFRADVVEIDALLERMVWRVVTRYAELSGTEPRIPSAAFYAVLDGLFQQALLRQLAGDPAAVAALRASVQAVLPQLVH